MTMSDEAHEHSGPPGRPTGPAVGAGEYDGIEPEDLGELLQRDAVSIPTVPVRVSGPVTVHELPARVAHSRALVVGDTPALMEQLGNADQRRKFLTVLCATQPVYIGFDKQDVANGLSGQLPTGIPLTLPTSAPIWVRCATAGQTSTVSYWAGSWAD